MVQEPMTRICQRPTLAVAAWAMIFAIATMAQRILIMLVFASPEVRTGVWSGLWLSLPELLLYGVAMIVIITFMPKGIVGTLIKRGNGRQATSGENPK